MNKKANVFVILPVMQCHGMHLQFGKDKQDGAVLVALSFHSQAAEKGGRQNRRQAG